MTVVENQDEVARLIAQALQPVSVPARKIPDIARPEIIMGR